MVVGINIIAIGSWINTEKSMAELLTIRKLIERVITDEIRIPAFQRDWVWTPQQVSFLLYEYEHIVM